MSRNNSSRLKAENKVEKEAKKALNDLQKMLNSGSRYTVPTEIVDLPSGGRFYTPESGFSGLKTIEIRHPTAKEEDILSNGDYISRGVVFDKFLDNIIVDQSIDHRKLLPGDRNALLVAARIAGYGSEYPVSMKCIECKKTEIFNFDLLKIKAKEFNLEENGVKEKEGHYSFHLPKANIEIEIRVLSSEDEEFLKEQKESKEKLNLETSNTVDFLRAIIVSAAGATDRALINEFTELLPAIDTRKIKSIYSKIVPGVDFGQEVSCPSCAAEQRREMPFSATFFWPDI